MIDLHTHSNQSDGSDPPERVAELAAERGLSGFALTDHDTVAGLQVAAVRSAELGIAFLPGIELSCHTSDRTVHLLGFGFDPDNVGLLAALERQQQARNNRNVLLVTRLQELGYDISLSDAVAVTEGGSLGRPHFARVLMERGHVPSIEAAFDQLLAYGRPAYIERRELGVADAVEMIASAGGVTAWAHPLPLRNGPFDERLLQPAFDELIAAGVSGIECWYSRYDPDDRRRMVKLARRRGLVPTGGSDYHGSYKPDLTVGAGTGNLQVPDDIWVELRERIDKLTN